MVGALQNAPHFPPPKARSHQATTCSDHTEDSEFGPFGCGAGTHSACSDSSREKCPDELKNAATDPILPRSLTISRFFGRIEVRGGAVW